MRFWPAGNTPEFSIVFDGRNTVSARELLDLSALLDGSAATVLRTTSLFMALVVAVLGGNLSDLTTEGIQDRAPSCFIGESFVTVRQEAAYELFEQFYPELYQAWESTPCERWLIFDTDRFLDSPSWTVAEVRLGSRVAVLVAPDYRHADPIPLRRSPQIVPAICCLASIRWPLRFLGHSPNFEFPDLPHSRPNTGILSQDAVVQTGFRQIKRGTKGEESFPQGCSGVFIAPLRPPPHGKHSSLW